MSPTDTLTQPALWPLSAIVFLPALVAAFLSLPIVPKAREEFIRWTTLLTTAVVFVLSLWMAVPLLALEAWGSGRMPSRVAAAIAASIYSSAAPRGPASLPTPSPSALTSPAASTSERIRS
jgi:hypothetical protein